MTYDDVVRTTGAGRAEHLRTLSLEIYRRAAEQAATSGIILADTKFEFGVTGDGTLLLADEILTPDSSRYRPADDWQPGRAQQSYDKQYVRDWLTGASGWDRISPPPLLPAAVVEQARARYVGAFTRLTGREVLRLGPHHRPDGPSTTGT